jgi:hypothetical protein
MRVFLLAILLLLFVLQPPPAVPLSATFVTSTSAVVSWQQPAGVRATCLRIYHAGAEWPAGICYENLPAGLMKVELPGTLPPDPAFRPQSGDRLVLAFGMEDVGSAILGQTVIHTTYLPLLNRQTAPAYRVRLAVVRA